MVFVARFRNFAVPATDLISPSSNRKGHFEVWRRDLNVEARLNCHWKSLRLRAFMKTMLNSRASTGPLAIVNVMQEKDDTEGGGYVSGGWKSEDGRLSYGYSSIQGRRRKMEDFFDVKISVINEQAVSLFGIFDGHGGSCTAQYLKEHLFENLINHPLFLTDTKLAISETYQRTDSDFLEMEINASEYDGSTALTSILIGNQLFVANVGDSRVVMSKAGKAIPLSNDHKPNRIDEQKRIEDAGGFVAWAGTWRVGGTLAMSRAFGNRLLKKYVPAEPEIQEEEFDEKLELLVLASDGLWDTVSNEDAISIARLEEDPEAAARKLMATAFSRGSLDNITCIVVRFNNKLALDSTL